MRRVVVTGLGLISSLGEDEAAIFSALEAGRSGLRLVPEWEQYGITSLVAGTLKGVEAKRKAARLPRNLRLARDDAAELCCLAALDAVADAGLEAGELSTSRTGCLVGSGVASVRVVHDSAALMYAGKLRRVRPGTVLQSMSSSASSSVTQLLGVGGRSYSIAAACSTSAHSIGHGFELVRAGVLDRAICGGGEAVNELVTGSFQALRMALSVGYNDRPEAASRPFDSGRDGFVISGGAGIVVIESEELARARGARIRAELLGYGACSETHDLVQPSPDGGPSAECMQLALADAGLTPGDIDYVNTHGTATIVGDVSELAALRTVFGDAATMPPFSSTKSLGGHAIGAAGAHELIYCIGMLEGGFIAPSINVDDPDPAVGDLPLSTAPRKADLRTIQSNSFGFGGTNASLIARKA